MLNIIKSKATRLVRFAAFFALPLAVPLLISTAASAQAGNGVDIAGTPGSGGLCTGSNLSFDVTPSGACNTQGQTKINTLLKDIVNIFSIVVGIIAVIMIIVGGFRYIMSGGDSGNVSGAKNAIIYALIGLVIVALAQVIVHFVLARASTAGTGG